MFVSGHAVDVIVFVIVAEFVWLINRGVWSVTNALLRLFPGVLMLVALRSALTGLDWYWIALPLMLSFPINIADLRRTTRK